MKYNGFLLEDGLLALVTLMTAAMILALAAQALSAGKEPPIETVIDTQWFHAD